MRYCYESVISGKTFTVKVASKHISIYIRCTTTLTTALLYTTMQRNNISELFLMIHRSTSA